MKTVTLVATEVSEQDFERTESFASSLPQGSPVAVVLQNVLEAISRGVDVSFLESDQELSPNKAATLLNVSRPHLLKIMDRGLLKYRLVGNNRRIAMADLMDYIDRHERANAYLQDVLGTQVHSQHSVRDEAAQLDESDFAELNALLNC